MKENISDKQIILNITDKNYKIYDELKKIKSGSSIWTNKEIIISVLAAILNALIVLVSAVGLAIIYKLVSDIKFILSTVLILGVDLSAQYGLIKMSTKLMKKSRLKTFKKKYPNIETNVDLNELDNALNKYKELLKSKSKEKEHYINIDVDKDINELEKYMRDNKEVRKESTEKINYIEDSNNFDKENVKTLKKTYSQDNYK